MMNSYIHLSNYCKLALNSSAYVRVFNNVPFNVSYQNLKFRILHFLCICE